MVEHLLQSLATSFQKHAEDNSVKQRVRARVLHCSQAELALLSERAALKTPALTKKRVWQHVAVATTFKSESLLHMLQDSIVEPLQVKQSIWQRVQSNVSTTAYSWLQIDKIKWGAAITAVAFIATISPRLVVAPPLLAESEVLLSVTKGEVTVFSNNFWSPITEDFAVTSGAAIRTMAGEATISVRDDAVIRLAPYTIVRVLDISDHTDSAVENIPTFAIETGSVWMQGLVPMNVRGTTVQLPQGQLTVNEGSVSVDVQENASIISVWDRRATVHNAAFVQNITVGERLVLSEKLSMPSEIVVDSINNEEFDDDWPRKNLAKDAVHRKYIAHVQHERLSALAGTLPTSSLYPVKRLAERVDVLLTFNNEARMQKQINQASLRLSEAAALLSEGSDTDVVEASLQEYVQSLNEVLSDSQDPTLSHMLVSQSLSDTKADTAAAKPSDTTYVIKKTVLLASSELQDTLLTNDEDKLTLVSDSLDEIALEVRSGNFEVLNSEWSDVQLALNDLQESGLELSEERQEITKILENIAVTVEENPAVLTELDQQTVEQIAEFAPEQEPEPIVYKPAAPEVFLTEADLDRITQQMYDRIYIYSSARGRQNQLRTEIIAIDSEKEKGRILRALYQKLPAGSQLTDMVRDEITIIRNAM